MAECISIDGVDYPGYIEQEPEEMGSLQKNKSTIMIYPQDYKLIHKGDFIMYTTDEGSNGGTLVKFIEPNYFILALKKQKLIWTIEAEDNIYIRDYSSIRRHEKFKNYLYKLYKEGYIDLEDIESKKNQSNML